MKRYILGVLLLPALSLAEPVTVDKPVLCDKTSNVLKWLAASDFKEIPIFLGDSKNEKYVLAVNKETQTFTLIQLNESVACIIGDGQGFKISVEALGNSI